LKGVDARDACVAKTSLHNVLRCRASEVDIEGEEVPHEAVGAGDRVGGEEGWHGLMSRRRPYP